VEAGGSCEDSWSREVGGDEWFDLGNSLDIRTYFPSSSNVKSKESSSIESSDEVVEAGRAASWPGGVCGNDTRLANSRVDVWSTDGGEIDVDAMGRGGIGGEYEICWGEELLKFRMSTGRRRDALILYLPRQ
jgi:hypothetical protein